MDAHEIDVRVLGGFDVAVDGRRLPPGGWRRRSAASLVKLLALAPGRRLHRERVLAALWPDDDPTAAAPRLHQAAHYARRWLGTDGSLVLSDEAVALHPDDRVTVDAVAFEGMARAAVTAADPAAAGAAADTYPGDLLPDDLYEPWTGELRDRLRLLHQDVLRLAGRWGDVAAADPADERAHVEVARRLAAAGDRPAALRQFERLERALRTELGVGLSPEAARFRDSLLASGATVAAAPRGPGLLGRRQELAWVRQVLAGVHAGRGRVLFVGGPAGVGKTSLLTAVGHEAAALRMRVGSGAAARIDGAWPYAPVLEAFADLCRRHPALLDGLDDHMREEIERALSGRHGEWDGQGAHQRLFVATAELLRLAAAGGGAVLLLDDLHEADEASLRLVHFLARSTVTERVAIVVGHRPADGGVLADVRSSLQGRGSAAVLDLRPLRPPDAEALAARHAPDAPPELLRAVAAASGGLPFAVVEGARVVAADPSAPPGAAFLPAELDPGVLRALAQAAVLGSSFDTDEFVALSGMTDAEAYAVLEAALAARLLRRTREGLAFGHALQREALLDRWLGQGGRRAAHRAAARALQRLGRSPGRIGHHLVHAGNTAAAVPWVLEAVRTEAALGAYRDALAMLETVRGSATGEDRADLLALRADLLAACGDLGALDAYREALSATDEPVARNRLRTRLARTATQRGDLETATIALDGLALDGSANDGDLLMVRGTLALYRRDFGTAADAAAEARRRIALGGPTDLRLFELVTLQGLLAHYRGEWFQQLRAELRTGVQRPDLAVQLFDSHLCVAEVLLYGPTPYDEVLALAADLRRTAEKAGALRAVGFAAALAGEAALLKGDLDLAEAELTDAADLHHGLEMPGGEAVALQRLAEVHVRRGDPAAAAPLLQRALPLARWSIVAQCLLPRIYATMIDGADDVTTSLAVVDRAESSLAPEDHCPFCAIMFALPAARACAAGGELDRARRFLATAETVVARWDGTAWQAALCETRAHVARAEGDEEAAGRLLAAAAALFETAGQPLDAVRCRASVAGHPAAAG
ncbi:AAA family ATPase [Geodermatophilus sp. YIM 151500]|uniref:ATP-binding protein n=1 Tax=Geodermatophilus sp. YIM 151500 TaxID=2984531 RepID=UPI0021E4075F|nr:AAA family ATPase [Geodermatophilus sp. YIM 151500]MCV2491282.1 AAA family ATPase [Geodermatophilus sp. YIM 151500]